jgi:hypothetical protein
MISRFELAVLSFEVTMDNSTETMLPLNPNKIIHCEQVNTQSHNGQTTNPCRPRNQTPTRLGLPPKILVIRILRAGALHAAIHMQHPRLFQC